MCVICGETHPHYHLDVSRKPPGVTETTVPKEKAQKDKADIAAAMLIVFVMLVLMFCWIFSSY